MLGAGTASTQANWASCVGVGVRVGVSVAVGAGVGVFVGVGPSVEVGVEVGSVVGVGVCVGVGVAVQVGVGAALRIVVWSVDSATRRLPRYTLAVILSLLPGFEQAHTFRSPEYQLLPLRLPQVLKVLDELQSSPKRRPLVRLMVIR